jgi:hypothetical protein
VFNLLFVVVNYFFELVVINHKVKGNHQANKSQERDEMRPDVNTFVVNHKQTFEEFAPRVEIDAVTLMDLVIVLHEVRG